MKSKRLIQVFVVLMLMVSVIGGSQPALASTNSSLLSDAVVVNRNLNIWDATYLGFVTSSVFEKWHLDLTETHTFVVTAAPVNGVSDVVPLLILQDSNGAELARGTNSLTSTLSAGTYFIQVEPESGGGFYFLTFRNVVQTLPSSTTVVSPTSINVGETALVTVSLNNVPPEGFTSAEFTCTYSATLIEVSNIATTNLFGADAAVAINGPQGGSFIVAIAGSNGNKATTSGPAFTFNALGLQPGQTTIDCAVRVSKGDNVLTELPFTGATLTVLGVAPSPTFTPTPFDTPTPTSSAPAETATPTSTPVGSPTATSQTPVGSATPTSTPVESPTSTATSTPVGSATPTDTSTPLPSPTATPLPNGTVTGTVLAGKPVTVGLYGTGNTLVASVTANGDGTFSLPAPAGTYTVRATASGFLSAEGSVTVADGGSASMPTITLLAGDIDGNNVIDQFDALTIGMSYNTNAPATADLNNDGTINVLDLELLAKNYRKTGPLPWGVSYP